MSRELTTFVHALLGLAVMGAAFLLVVFSLVTNNAGVPEPLPPFLPLVVGVGVFVGARIIRAAYRDAVRR